MYVFLISRSKIDQSFLSSTDSAAFSLSSDAASSAGRVVGLEEAAVVVVQGVEQHLRLILEVVGEPPVRPGNKDMCSLA